MWCYRSAARPANNVHEVASDAGTYVRVGKSGLIGRATPFALRQRDPSRPVYERVRFDFGVSMGGSSSRHPVWTARIENLRTSSGWAHLTRCRAVIALDAFATTIDDEQFWFECEPGQVAYAACLYEGRDRGGFAVITEPAGYTGERKPLLITPQAVAEWLNPEANPPLGMIADLARADVPMVEDMRRAQTFSEAARGVLSAINSVKREQQDLLAA